MMGGTLHKYWSWLLLSGVVVMAAWFRVVVVEKTIVPNPVRNDAIEYWMSAHNLVFHGVYSSLNTPAPEPDSLRWPGLPLVEAALMVIIGKNDWSTVHELRWLNAGAGVAAVALILVAAAMALPLWAALAAGVLTALSPHLISFTVYLLTEPIAAMLCALLLAMTALTFREDRRISWWIWLGLGVIVAILAMFRPFYLLLGPALILALPKLENKRRAVAGLVVGTALVMAPWFLRNAVSVATNDRPSMLTETLLCGSYPGYIRNGDVQTFPYPYLADPAAPQLLGSLSAAVGDIVRRFADDPAGMAWWYAFGKTKFLWQWDNIDGIGDVFIYPIVTTPFTTDPVFVIDHAIMKAGHWGLIVLALVGSIAVWMPAAARLLPRRGVPILRVGSIILAYTTLILIPLQMVARYAVPAYPVMYLMAMVPVVMVAAMAAAAATRRRRPREPGTTPPEEPKERRQYRHRTPIRG
jgi:4-amino-4-deoxy-L-arabinose transferase-like glycosyltransferase